MSPAELLRCACFGAVGALAAATDVRERRIPDRTVGVGLILSFLLARSPMDSIAGALLGFVLFWGVRRLTDGKLGLGDVKLSAFLGSILGPGSWWSAVAVASLGGLGYLAVVSRGSLRRGHEAVPFAPFLVAGSFVAELAGLVVRSAEPPRETLP